MPNGWLNREPLGMKLIKQAKILQCKEEISIISLSPYRKCQMGGKGKTAS